ncbi:MAG TPA: threonine--tRNA ligase [Candidatus Woesearchaeota archaeon]|nr:threonine--tRNA ligase [Candidatus Woesearchaeota archaeon]
MDEKTKSKTEEVSKAIKAEETLKSYWYILDIEGNLHELNVENGEVTGFDFSSYQNLKKFAQYEMAKKRVYDKEPPHIELMKKLELVDFEPATDPGNFRYYPAGRFVKKQLENYVSRETVKYGGMEVETPIMYSYTHPALKSYLDRFPARHYIVKSGEKDYFLRFAACFGQFLMAHDATISYRNLPLRLYELSRYSFRREQSGELAGIKRLRGFTMPDCHAFVKDFDQGKEEMIKRFELAQNIMSGIGFSLPEDFEIGIRFVKSFYEEHKDLAMALIKKWGKPMLLEMWDERFFYFSMKYEWNFIDAMDKASGIVTDQFDVENAERYNITFTDEDGKKKHPIILHLSPSGAIERVIYAWLEKVWMEEQNSEKAAMLPVWLSPEQVRILPVADRHIEFADKLVKELEAQNIRVGLDDRSLSVPKKVFQSKMAWVPYIIVVGDKEAESGRVPVVVRSKSKSNEDYKEEMSVDELVSRIQNETKNMPIELMPIPKNMSKRPIFFSRA